MWLENEGRKRMYYYIRTIKTKMLVIVILFLFWASCGKDANLAQPNGITPGDYTYKISVGSMRREYVVHVPTLYNEDHPSAVVIMFHGGGGTAQDAITETGWNKKADRGGFLAVFPEGSRQDPDNPASFSNNPQTWNDGSNRPTVGAVRREIDDVRFVSALIDDLIARFNVDERRIYATGFSNGASMTFRVGRELSGRLAAIAPTAGSDWLEKRPIGRPISLLYMTGTADPLNPIDGGEIFIGQTSYGIKPPVQQTIQKWVQMLSCPADSSVIYNSDGVIGMAYSPCMEGSEVVFYTIDGMGHWWPGWIPPDSYPSWLMNIFGNPSDKIQGTDVIWEFFQMHHKK
ncbi:hypothetical protein KKG19_04650 [Patescibacteria group bacterium]|nr:hypothetical protein [Patescibacteria group bacterium]